KLAEPSATPAQIRDALMTFANHVESLKPHLGDLRPSDQVMLSGFAGTPSNRATDAQLPAGNVAALGRALFNDYLLGIEMAGTLLLVATIGAIAITHRHSARRAA